MSEVLHANIFFFIASVAVVIFIIIISLILYQLLKVTQSIRRITERIEVGSERLSEDMDELRTNLKASGFFANLLGFFFGARSGGSRRRSARKEAEDE